MRVEEPVAPGSLDPEAAAITEAEERISVAPQWQLMWWRFRKHRLAVVASGVLLLYYMTVVFADFLAYSDPVASEAQRSLIAPQGLHLFDEGRFSPHVDALAGKRDPQTFKRVYAPDPDQKVPVSFFARGFEYKLFGFISWDRHLIGINAEGKSAEDSLFLLGTDVQGRDVWSRLMYGSV